MAAKLPQSMLTPMKRNKLEKAVVVLFGFAVAALLLSPAAPGEARTKGQSALGFIRPSGTFSGPLRPTDSTAVLDQDKGEASPEALAAMIAKAISRIQADLKKIKSRFPQLTNIERAENGI